MRTQLDLNLDLNLYKVNGQKYWKRMATINTDAFC